MMGSTLGRGGGGPAMYGVSGHGFGAGSLLSKVRHSEPVPSGPPSSPPPAPPRGPRPATKPSTHGRAAPIVPKWDRAALVYADGAWWRWGKAADGTRGVGSWVVVASPCTRWTMPLEPSSELRAIASKDLEQSQGQPVARVVASVLYMFSLDWTGDSYALRVRTCAGSPVSLGTPPPASTLGAIAAPTLGKVPHPKGGAGLKKSVDEVVARVVRDADDPFVIAWARQTIHAAHLPEPRGYPDPTKQIRALFEALKKKVSFVRDGVNREVMASTRQLLCLDPKDHCIPGGDCDEAIIALMATARAIGIPVRVYVCFYKDMPEAHIMMLFDADTYLRGKWTCFDPSTDGGTCPALKPEWEYLEAIDMDAALEFNGLGNPPPRSFGDPTATPTTTPTTTPSTTTASTASSTTTATAATLTQAQTDAWVAQLTSMQASLTQTTTTLQTVAAQYAQFRSDMGQPAVDTAPTGDNAIQSGTSYLSAYMSSGGVMGVVNGGTGYWTSGAQQQEQQLIAGLIFAGQCISDALAGARAMQWDNTGTGDLDIAAAAGDTMRINMLAPTDGSGTTPVPTFVNPASGQPTGTVGELPAIAVGALTTIAITVVAIFAVEKIATYLATAHQQDMVQTVVGTQQQLIASGAATPAASTAFLNAATDLAKATNPNPPPAPGMSWWEVGGIGALCAAGGWAVAKFL
jgi:Transglutaminase-like superfamily